MYASPQKITFAEMRSSGVRGLLVYCSDYHCSHYIAINGDQWQDEVRLSDIEPRFVCSACGERGAEIRPDCCFRMPPIARRLGATHGNAQKNKATQRSKAWVAVQMSANPFFFVSGAGSFGRGRRRCAP
jgi:hypothetical protein